MVVWVGGGSGEGDEGAGSWKEGGAPFGRRVRGAQRVALVAGRSLLGGASSQHAPSQHASSHAPSAGRGGWRACGDEGDALGHGEETGACASGARSARGDVHKRRSSCRRGGEAGGTAGAAVTRDETRPGALGRTTLGEGLLLSLSHLPLPPHAAAAS